MATNTLILLVACPLLALVLLVIVGVIVGLRYLSYRETLALAEKGLVRPEQKNGKDTLRWGIILAALGLALCLGLWPLGASFTTNPYPLGLGPWMLLGLLPLFFGLALILIYVLTHDQKIH